MDEAALVYLAVDIFMWGKSNTSKTILLFGCWLKYVSHWKISLSYFPFTEETLNQIILNYIITLDSSVSERQMALWEKSTFLGNLILSGIDLACHGNSSINDIQVGNTKASWKYCSCMKQIIFVNFTGWCKQITCMFFSLFQFTIKYKEYFFSVASTSYTSEIPIRGTDTLCNDK